jgi:polysaccharide biosynthesis transport protein
MSNLIPDDAEPGPAPGGGLISHLPAILWDRRWWIIIPAIVGILLSVAAALLIPPVYRATAVMLVQSPQLPDEIIGQMGDGLVERRIEAIRQRVTARPDLVELINRHGLYAQRRSSDSLSDIIEDMRDSITLTPTTLELPGSGANQRTIAFELAFDYREAAPAQAVTQDLMDRILQLDASGNLEQATNTAQFLADQAQDLQSQMADVEGRISAINTRYGRVLGSTGMAVIGSGTGNYDVQIASLQRDNANLVAQKETARSGDTRDPLVMNAEAALAGARAVYADSHPDVVIARQRLEEARALARTNTQRLPIDTIDQQIAFNNSQIAALRAAKAQEQAQVSSQLTAQSQAPLVLQQLEALQQRLAGLNQQYQTVQGRLLAARAGVRAEDEQMGQRLAVVEPPIIPEEPIWPDRLLIVALGSIAGIGLGALLALGTELVFRPIRDPRALTQITGVSPLGVVPKINRRNRRAGRPGQTPRRWGIWRPKEGRLLDGRG